MEDFDFYFGLLLGDTVMRQLDNFSAALQHTELSAAGAHDMMEKTVKTLDSVVAEEQYNLFWKKVVHRASKIGVGEPALPRKRNKPVRFHDEEDNEIYATPFDHYRAIYTKAFIRPALKESQSPDRRFHGDKNQLNATR